MISILHIAIILTTIHLAQSLMNSWVHRRFRISSQFNDISLSRTSKPFLRAYNDLKIHEGAINRSNIPSRYDTCLVIADGVIGMDPKDTYLKNGHHVINFPIAFVGHFPAAHDWEKLKPTETMWVSSEIWDSAAEKYRSSIKRGMHIKCVGHLISNKWIDKNSGDERKQFRFRVIKLLTDVEFLEISNILELTSEKKLSSSWNGGSESNFSSDFPNEASQLQSFHHSLNHNKINQQQDFSHSTTASQFVEYPTWDTFSNSQIKLNENDYWQ